MEYLRVLRTRNINVGTVPISPHSLCICHGQNSRGCRLPNKTEFQAGVWNTSMPKEFLMHVKQAIHTCDHLNSKDFYDATLDYLKSAETRQLASTSPSSMTSSWLRRVTLPTWSNMRKTGLKPQQVFLPLCEPSLCWSPHPLGQYSGPPDWCLTLDRFKGTRAAYCVQESLISLSWIVTSTTCSQSSEEVPWNNRSFT